MTPNMKSPSAFLVIALDYDGKRWTPTQGALVMGSSAQSNWIDLEPPAVIRPGYTEIGDYIAAQERDPSRRALLEQARREIAQRAYGDRPTTLRQLRLARGWSQARLAETIGSTQAQIARIENADTDPQASTLERVAEALGEDPSTVFLAFMAAKLRKRAGTHGR